MYECNELEIDLIQDSPLLTTKFLVQGSKHYDLENFTIELDKDGAYSMYLNSVWVKPDSLLGDLEIIKNFATKIDGKLVDEDEHTWKHWRLEGGKIKVYGSEIVYNYGEDTYE